jgi:hypothetical protein
VLALETSTRCVTWPLISPYNSRHCNTNAWCVFVSCSCCHHSYCSCLLTLCPDHRSSWLLPCCICPRVAPCSASPPCYAGNICFHFRFPVYTLPSAGSGPGAKGSYRLWQAPLSSAYIMCACVCVSAVACDALLCVLYSSSVSVAVLVELSGEYLLCLSPHVSPVAAENVLY